MQTLQPEFLSVTCKGEGEKPSTKFPSDFYSCAVACIYVPLYHMVRIILINNNKLSKTIKLTIVETHRTTTVKFTKC